MSRPPFESTEEPTKYADFYGFRVGTCNGLWRSTDDAYEILFIANSQKGNGHFQETMWWFEQSCKRDGKKLVILEVWNESLSQGLLKHGFKRRLGTRFDYEKLFA